jgi:hypothetical protein
LQEENDALNPRSFGTGGGSRIIDALYLAVLIAAGIAILIFINWLASGVHQLHSKIGLTQPLVSSSGQNYLIGALVLYYIGLILTRNRKWRKWKHERMHSFFLCGFIAIIFATCADRKSFHGPGPASGSGGPMPAGYTTQRVVNGINVRRGRDTSYAIITTIRPGTIIGVSPPDSRGWSQMYDRAGAIGYVYRRGKSLQPIH